MPGCLETRLATLIAESLPHPDEITGLAEGTIMVKKIQKLIFAAPQPRPMRACERERAIRVIKWPWFYHSPRLRHAAAQNGAYHVTGEAYWAFFGLMNAHVFPLLFLHPFCNFLCRGTDFVQSKNKQVRPHIGSGNIPEATTNEEKKERANCVLFRYGHRLLPILPSEIFIFPKTFHLFVDYDYIKNRRYFQE